MRFIENSDLREWVKENLRKAIFQKAHALAVQTGCDVLVKLEDSKPLSDKNNSCQYYATNTIKDAFRSIGVREKPGDKAVCGETGLPTTPTVDSAVQSCAEDYTENNIALNVDSTKDTVTNCKSSSPSNTNLDSLFPLQLTVTSEPSKICAPLTSVRLSNSQEATSNTNNKQSDKVLDFSRKASQGETQTNTEETATMESSASPENSTNNVAMETEQSPIIALLQRPGLLPVDSERYTCQICSRSFPKQQLFRDHMSRSHMQASMSLVIQAAQPQQLSIGTVPSAGLDHVPSDSPPPADMSIGPHNYPTPMPVFSSLVQGALADGTIQKVWDLFIRESTDFYFPDMPHEDGKARIVYQNIGRTMYEKYPCIGSEGQTPWSHFNKSLSTKIRWRRQKRKWALEPGGGGRPAKRPNSTPSPSGSPNEDVPRAMSTHSEDDVKPDINELNRQILLAQQLQGASQLLLHIPAESTSAAVLGQLHPFPSASPSAPSTSMVGSPPMVNLGIPSKGLKKNILMQTGFYLTPELAAMGFSSTLQMTTEKVVPLLKQMSKEGYGIWVEDPVDKNKCGFIKWYPLNEKQRAEVNLTNEQYKRACVAKPQQPRVLSKEMEQFFDACGGRKVRQNMSLL